MAELVTGEFHKDEDKALRKMVADGFTRQEIALALNRKRESVGGRMRKLCMIFSRSNSKSWRERRNHDSIGPAGVPLDLGPGDERYVNTCLSHGGFASCAQTNDGRFVFGHAGKAWAQP